MVGRALYFGNDQADFGGTAPVVWGQPSPFSGDPDYEIMGAYEILGDVSATPAMKAAAQGILARSGKVVGTVQPRREYSQVLPCTSLAITTLATREIQLNPQRPFRPEKFRASSTHTAPFFVITAYSIGQDNQFVGPGSIPVDLFSEVALYSQIEAYTANLGSLITLTVQNIDTNTRDFRAAFFGTSLGN